MLASGTLHRTSTVSVPPSFWLVSSFCKRAPFWASSTTPSNNRTDVPRTSPQSVFPLLKKRPLPPKFLVDHVDFLFHFRDCHKTLSGHKIGLSPIPPWTFFFTGGFFVRSAFSLTLFLPLAFFRFWALGFPFFGFELFPPDFPPKFFSFSFFFLSEYLVVWSGWKHLFFFF